MGVCCCSNQGQHAHRKQRGPDISSLDLTLQQQWDVAANAHLGDIVITPHSNRKVSWTCDQCPDSHLHSWSASVTSRSNGSDCPQCIGRKVCRHSSLATKAPWAAAQWDYEANDGTPDTVVAQSNKTAHWLCDACNHKWTASTHRRVSRGTGCPECARFKKTWTKRPTFANHPLLAEWDHKRNAASQTCLVVQPSAWQLAADHQLTLICSATTACKAEAHSRETGSCCWVSL